MSRTHLESNVAQKMLKHALDVTGEPTEDVPKYWLTVMHSEKLDQDMFAERFLDPVFKEVSKMVHEEFSLFLRSFKTNSFGDQYAATARDFAEKPHLPLYDFQPGQKMLRQFRLDVKKEFALFNDKVSHKFDDKTETDGNGKFPKSMLGDWFSSWRGLVADAALVPVYAETKSLMAVNIMYQASDVFLNPDKFRDYLTTLNMAWRYGNPLTGSEDVPELTTIMDPFFNLAASLKIHKDKTDS